MTVAEKTNQIVLDDAILESIEKLDEKKIERVINQMIGTEGGARFKAYLNTCMSCGYCSEACHYYLSLNDPRMTPAAKVKQTLGEFIGSKGRISKETLAKACEIAFTDCNLCRRCMMYCPFGIDVAYLMLFVRRVCHKLGVVPRYIQDTAHSHSVTMNQMWSRRMNGSTPFSGRKTRQEMKSPTSASLSKKRGPKFITQLLDLNRSSVRNSSTRPQSSCMPQR
jgi:Fe-S oxidoreductase